MELTYMAALNNLLKNIKLTLTRVFNSKEIIDYNIQETEQVQPYNDYIWNDVKILKLYNDDIQYKFVVSSSLREDKYPHIGSNNINIKYNTSYNKSVSNVIGYIPGISIIINKVTSKTIMRISEPKHVISSFFNNSINDNHYDYIISPDIMAYAEGDIRSNQSFKSGIPMVFKEINFVKKLIYDISKTDEEDIVFESDLLNAISHFDSLINNILTCDKNIIRQNILRNVTQNYINNDEDL